MQRPGWAGDVRRTASVRRLVAASLTALAAASCQRAAAPSSRFTVLVQGDEHILSLPWDVPPKFLVFLPLVTRNAEGELEGALATRWEHSPDFRTWTVHLRTDVRWHDGAPFTAHDVEFTLDLLAHPEVLWAAPNAYRVTVLDDSTYTITYRQSGPGNPLDDWTVYYPRHLLEGLDPAEIEEWGFWVRPVGNGPYRYLRHVPKTMMEFEANPDFYRGQPAIDRIVLKFAPPLITELLSGAVDVVSYVTPIDVLKVEGDPRFLAYHAFEPANGDMIAWNQRRAPFDDSRIRRALTHAIDRRELHGVLNFPATTPLFDGPFTERQFRRGELPDPIPYDPAAAERLFDEAGWRVRGDDGVRRRQDRPFRFTAVVAPMFMQEKAAVYVQEQLRRVGVTMEIERLEFGAIIQRVREGEFGALFIRMPLNGEWARLDFFGADSPIGYRNPKVMELLDQVRSTVDPDARDAAHRELTAIFQADVPMTYLAPGVAMTIAHRRVRGLSSPYRASPFWHADELWLAWER